MQLENGICSSCSHQKPIVNRKHKLCNECNRKRLHPNEDVKVYQLKRTPLKPASSPLKRSIKPIAQRSKKSASVLKLDEEVYELVFNRAIKGGECKCENCDKELDPFFRDDQGRVAQRFRYSHILSKAAYPELRYVILNFNFLCFKCHELWEFGGDKGRKTMRIFVKNQKIIVELYKLSHSK